MQKPGSLDVFFNGTGKKVIFLTGAGISYSAGIVTQQAIEKDLGIEYGKPVDQYIKNWLNNSEKEVALIQKFFREMLKEVDPTHAHYALAKLTLHTGSQITTSNFDNLHQKYEILPVQIKNELRKDSWKKELNQNIAQHIDAIICIGSRTDPTAFLSKYKKLNSLGVIVSIDKEQPFYLGNDDFFIKGDIQKIVPKLADLVLKK